MAEKRTELRDLDPVHAIRLRLFRCQARQEHIVGCSVSVADSATSESECLQIPMLAGQPVASLISRRT